MDTVETMQEMERLQKELGSDGLVFPLPVERPEVVTLCGSTRYWQTFTEASLMFTLMGKVVLSVGAATASDEDHGITDEQKLHLDALHLHKIALSDYIFVLNVDGYIGHSTAREIMFATVVEHLPIYWHDRDRIPSPEHVLAKAHGTDLDKVDRLWISERAFTMYPWDLRLMKDFGISNPGHFG